MEVKRNNQSVTYGSVTWERSSLQNKYMLSPSNKTYTVPYKYLFMSLIKNIIAQIHVYEQYIQTHHLQTLLPLYTTTRYVYDLDFK